MYFNKEGEGVKSFFCCLTGLFHSDKEYIIMKGWVYVISNKAMDGLVKVGYSTKDPELRAEELNHTGSPHPYVVEYEALVEEPRQIEQKVHKLLSNTNEGKEWFRCSVEVAVAAIYQATHDSPIITENLKKTQREKVEQINKQKREEREIEEKFRAEANRIDKEYKEIIAKRFAPRPLWQYWLGGSFLSLFGIVILLPKTSDEAAIIIAAISGGGIGAFFKDYFEGKKKESPEYKINRREG